MELACISDNEEGNWEWTGQFTRSTCDVDGHSVQLIDPAVIHSTRLGRDQMPTYCFKSSELIAIAAALYGSTRSDVDTISSVSWSEMFPYRLPNGELLPPFKFLSQLLIIVLGSVCFICEDEGSPRGEIQDKCCCPRCPTLRLPKSRQSELVLHMGMHILHDNRESHGSGDPCGLAGRVSQARAWVGKFPPSRNPHPQVRVHRQAQVFFSSPSSHPLRCRRPRSHSKSPLLPQRSAPAPHGSEQQSNKLTAGAINNQQNLSQTRNQQTLSCRVAHSFQSNIPFSLTFQSPGL
jgi:hypothetical protein